MIQGNPMIREDELGLLSKFGLVYNYPEFPWVTIFEDGRVVRAWKDLDRTCEASPNSRRATPKPIASLSRPARRCCR